MGRIEAAVSERGRRFQDIADEAFADFLKKHRQPVGLKAALKESVGDRPALGHMAWRIENALLFGPEFPFGINHDLVSKTVWYCP